jgi:type II secretion system protein J
MKSRRAFTLVELLVATGILAMLLAAGSAVFSAGVRAAEKTRRHGGMVAQGQRALRLIAADLAGATELEDFRLVSLDVQDGGHDCDTLDFILLRRSVDRKGPDEGGRAEVGYSLPKGEQSVERGLLRREDRSCDEDPLEGGETWVVAPSVSDLDFEFFDGYSWAAGWQDRNSLPVAVRVSLVVTDEDGIEPPMLFSTTAPIMSR